MGLGPKAKNSRIDTLILQNMRVQHYERRSYMQEIDFTNILKIMKEFNAGRAPEDKVRIPAILIRAVALAYDYTDEKGDKPFRRLSGVISPLPWGGSWESETIDISLMIVRELDGVKNQTCAYAFRAVNTLNTLAISREIWDAVKKPEDEIQQFRFLKQIAHIPPVITFFLLQLTKIPWIRAQVMAPTSVSILRDDIKWGQGEHTSMFGLTSIDKETSKGFLLWTFDHRLGMGLHFGPFIAHLKGLLESGDFLRNDVES